MRTGRFYRTEGLLKQAIELSPNSPLIYMTGDPPNETIYLPHFALQMTYWRSPPYLGAKARMYAGILYGIQQIAEAHFLTVLTRAEYTADGYLYSVKMGQGVGSTSQIQAIAWLSAYVDHLQRSSSKVSR